MTPVVRVVDVVKEYRRGPETVHALRGVSLDLVGGEVAALIGPSGSGKTTLLNILCGWERPDTGTIEWSDVGLRLAELDWNEVGIVPQRQALVEELPIRENVELPMLLAGWRAADRRARTAELLGGLHIDHLGERLPIEASLGEQQSVAVARALALRPTLVLADEPTSHQDADREVMIFEIFRATAADGGACLIATHDPRTDELCHRTVRVEDGRLISDERHDVAGDALDRRLWGRSGS